MDKNLDNLIKEKFKEDMYISKSTKEKINEILEENRNISIKKEVNYMKKLVSALAMVTIVFLGANVYAYSQGMPNIFSMLGKVLNINEQEYEKDKIVVNETKEIGTKENSLTLVDYAYNDEILILNYKYKTDNLEYKNVFFNVDKDKLCNIGDNEAGEYPNYLIDSKSVKNENEYSIYTVYDINQLRINENGIINVTIKEICTDTNTDYGIKILEECNLEFLVNVSKPQKKNKEYKLSTNIINLNLDKIKENEKNTVEGNERVVINKISNTKLADLIYLSTDLELSIYVGSEDGFEIYRTPVYTFEITDENGNILCERNSQELILALDSKEGVLIIKPIENSKELNIKVYEEISDSLVANIQKISIEK